MRGAPRTGLGAAAAALVVGIALAGCSRLPGIYRIDIQQGNVIDDAALARLEPGMPKRKVEFLIGTPAINDVFHEDRWDYVYTYKPGWGRATQRRVSLFFEDGKLARIEGDVERPLGEAAGELPERERVVDVPPDRGYGLLGRLRQSFARDETTDEATGQAPEASDQSPGAPGQTPEAPDHTSEAAGQATPETPAPSAPEATATVEAREQRPGAEAEAEAADEEGEPKSLFRRLADRFRIFGGEETEETVPEEDPSR